MGPGPAGMKLHGPRGVFPVEMTVTREVCFEQYVNKDFEAA